MKNLKSILSSIFLYKEPQNNYEFSLPESGHENDKNESIYNEPLPDKSDEQTIYSSLSVNIDYIKSNVITWIILFILCGAVVGIVIYRKKKK